MLRKKSRNKIAKLFRHIGVPFLEARKFSSQLVKHGFVYSSQKEFLTSVNWHLVESCCCEEHGPILHVKGWTGKRGFLPVDDVNAILHITK